MVFVKKTDSTAHAVNVAPAGSDTIETKYSNSSPFALSIQYASLTLISNGSNEWFIVSNAV
jgi:hypothetical protein